MRNLLTSNRLQWFLLLFSFVLLSGCAHVISKRIRAEADPSLAFGQIFQNPIAYSGKVVVWGGEIIETVNQEDGTTLIEVFQRPLGWRGKPNLTRGSEGRFLILAEEYLDSYLFWSGRKITVAGEVQGEEIEPLGEMEYRYPLLSSKEICLWADDDRYPYFYYYPGGYYNSFWGYPFGRRGFGFYYFEGHPHHHFHHHHGHR